MVARVVLVSALSTLLPLTYLLSSNQRAAAFISQSNTQLPLPPGSQYYCIDSDVFASALDVTVNNPYNKLVIAMLGGVVVAYGEMEAILESPCGALYDHAFETTHDSTTNTNSALTWTSVTGGQFEVKIRNTQLSGSACLTELDSDLRILCEDAHNPP